MQRSKGLLVGIWLVSAVVAGVAGGYAYRAITRVPAYPGRTDPHRIYDHPAILFEDPGVLGTAVEMRASEAVRECMAAAGYHYRDPARIVALDAVLSPEREGYGIAAGAGVPRPRLGGGGPGQDRSGYEQALYGSHLPGASGGAGCASFGRQALAVAVATLESLPYSIEQLEADALAHLAYRQALAEWEECMAARGHTASTPADLIVDFAQRLSRSPADRARQLAEEERRTAVADFACRRRTLDRALPEVAADLGPAFVERNRAQLATVIPPPATDLPEGLGTGDVQVTLVWRNGADLDLYVTDPEGATVYHGATSVPSGGQLDRDANFPCGNVSSPAAENVFWPTGQAPHGQYRATVRYFSDCLGEGPTDFELIIRVQGRVVERISRSLSPGEEFTVDFGTQP